MKVKKGIGVSPGIAIGQAFSQDIEQTVIFQRTIERTEVDRNIKRFEDACLSAIAELKEIKEKLQKKSLSESIHIINAHIKMIQDEYLHKLVKKYIRDDLYSVEFALSRAVRHFLKTMEVFGNKDIAKRISEDILDVEKRLIRILHGRKKDDFSQLRGNIIVVAKTLTPSQTMNLDSNKLAGLVTDEGGPTSHFAIYARSIGVPAAVGFTDIIKDVSSGDTLIVDGIDGTVIINPDNETLKKYETLAQNYILSERRISETYKNLPAITKDNSKIVIMANIETPLEIPKAIEFGAEGIGLYRTEFLLFNREEPPGENEQFNIYKESVKNLDGKPLTIRTFDIGADKFRQFTDEEKNPFLGCRAIRYCFEREDIFRTQIKSILKASHFGKVKLLFPLVSCVEEIDKLRQIVIQIKNELSDDGIGYNDKVPFGVMIETPSIAMVADIILKKVDYVSIGTNDLIQFSLAVDRNNERVSKFYYQPTHPAILRMIKYVIEQSLKNHREVSVCGEAASDPIYVILLLGLGLRNFSVSTHFIPIVKKIIRSVYLKQAREIAYDAMLLSSSQEISDFLNKKYREIVKIDF